MKPKIQLDLIDIDDTMEALAVRAALEWWGAQVTLHLPGEAKDLVRILGGGEELSKNIFLMCHGDERGFLLPELHPDLEQAQPYHGALTPSDLREFLQLPGRLVLSTGCSTGTPELASAFLGAGCRAYIGPDGDPSGDDSLFYVLHFGYEWICSGRDLHHAHELAASHSAGTNLFKLYQTNH